MDKIQSIYLAGAVDLGVDVNWKTQFQESLQIAGINVTTFDPAKAFQAQDRNNVTDEMSQFIECVNNAAIEMCDLVVCSLPSGVQTIGTVLELDLCKRIDKSIWLLTDIPRGKSVALNNRIDADNWIYVDSMRDEMELAKGINEIINRLFQYNTSAIELNEPRQAGGTEGI
jgi:nucleoside 2-deoxyribosyltransferase